jgi:hypothetical protein
VSETTTLRPLRSRDRAALTPEGDADILRQALDRFRLASESEALERAQQLEALRFRSGAHQTSALRSPSGEPYPAPAMTVDRQSAFLKQTVNAYRRAPLSIRVRPKSGGATKQIADVLEGKIREIEQESEAEIAYTVALDQAAGQGLGYFRLVTEWVDPHSFEQTLRICPIHSRFSVYVDPTARHPAGLDMQWAFIVERMSRDAFRSEYGMEPAPASQWSGTGDDVWYGKDEVQRADYFYMTWDEIELVQFPNGTVVPTQGIGEIDPTWPKRTTRIPTVWWAKMCGSAILKKTRWLGQYIPLIRVEGTRLDVDGQTLRTGIIQQTMTSQLAYDYAFNAEMEAIALAPKSPYKVYTEQISGLEGYWNRANDPYLPYLPVKAVVVGGQLLPPPQRDSIEPAIQALSQARQQAAADMQAVLGVFSASLGEPSNEQSGVAVQRRKIEGDEATYHFPANLAWSIRAVGLQIVDILPKLYSRPTTLRQIGKDGAVSMTPVNQRVQNAQGEMEEHLLSQGSYDVNIDVGPSYSTQREVAAERLGELGRVLPQELLPMIADLWIGSLDIPNSEELAARLKTIVPPEALAATKDKNPQTAIAALQNQLQQATQALQQQQQQLQEAQQIAEVSKQQLVLTEQRNATLETRLADKAQDNQLEAQKNQRDYEVEMRKLQLEEQKFLLEIQKAQQPQDEQVERNGV